MAVAVKTNPETTPQTPSNPLAVGTLVGLVYLLLSLVAVFYILPTLWDLAISAALTENANAFVNGALKLLAMVVAVGVLLFGGLKLVGSHPPHGLKAGVTLGLIWLFLIGLVTQWFGMILESWFYSSKLLGTSAPMVGLSLTILFGGLLLVWSVRRLFKAKTEKLLVGIEDQGWFSTAAYKRSQGLRVRRGTILGILLIVGCGIFSLLNRNTLDTMGQNWNLIIPFTGKVKVERLGEVDAVLVGDPGDSSFTGNQVVKKPEFEEVSARLEKEGKTPPAAGLIDRFALRDQTGEGTAPSGPIVYQALTLLPNIKFTIPLLLSLAALWFAYRVVNYPTFADFLIATEAEVNKVSWTTKKRLKQDTIVVLVTVILLTVFLFLADMVWAQVLTKIGVLQIDTSNQQDSGPKEQPW